MWLFIQAAGSLRGSSVVSLYEECCSFMDVFRYAGGPAFPQFLKERGEWRSIAAGQVTIHLLAC